MKLVPKPLPFNLAKEESPEYLTVTTSPEARILIKKFLSQTGSSEKSGIFDIDSKLFSITWEDPATRGQVVKLLEELQSCGELPLHWADNKNYVRTVEIRGKISSILESYPHHPNNFSTTRLRTFRNKILVQKNVSYISPITCLATKFLVSKDHENFSRVVASNPALIIRELLNEKKFNFGKIFTDENIWLTIAYSLPLILARGGSISPTLESLSEAFSNFLAFHNPKSTTGPYNVITKAFYKGGKRGADALVNNPDLFIDTIERLWAQLAPDDVSEASILSLGNEQKKCDSELGAALVNIVFSGVKLHLRTVADRKASHKRKMAVIFDLPGSAIQTAAQADPTKAASIVNEVALKPVTQFLLEQGLSKAGNLNTKSSVEQMKIHFDALYSSLSVDNASSGRFVIGQRVLFKKDLDGLVPEARLAAENQVDFNETVQSPSSSRIAMRDRLLSEGIRLSDDDLNKIRMLRIDQGQSFEDFLSRLTAANPYSKY